MLRNVSVLFSRGFMLRPCATVHVYQLPYLVMRIATSKFTVPANESSYKALQPESLQ
jgi:hypothetical protein